MIAIFIRGAVAARHGWHIRRDPIGYARSIGVRVGNDCRLIDITRKTFGSEPYLVQLGNHVTVTSEVRFVTHDGGIWVFREQYPTIEIVAPVIVGNNVFIGLRSIVLAGVVIGDNCVIGAGSVVTRAIPANTVAAGVPARPICSIDEYWRKVEKRARFTGSLPHHQKREEFEKMMPQRDRAS